MAWVGRWDGGRTTIDSRGRERWVIERMVSGASYSITLDVSSLREARAELALFLRDPASYRTKARAAADARAGAVAVNAELVARFLQELKRLGRVRAYRLNTRGHLAWWVDELADRDLRAVTLAELHRMLDKVSNRKGRIIALKSLCSFLRERGELNRQNDPTLDLLVPPPVPEKDARTKGHTIAAATRAYRMMESQVVRDVCRVRWNTGMHLSELVSLVEAGEIRALPGYGEISGVLRFWHKSRKLKVCAVDAPTLAAAQRLKDRGLPFVSRNWLQDQLDAASASARVGKLELGAMRHSYATWCKDHGEKIMPHEGGLSLADVADALGHASPKTTRRFYDESEVPPMYRVPALKLEHPDDPAQLPARVTEAR